MWAVPCLSVVHLYYLWFGLLRASVIYPTPAVLQVNLKRKHWKESADKKPKDRLQQVFKRQMAQAELRTKSAAIPQAQQKYLVDAYRCPLGLTTMCSRSVCVGGPHHQTAPPNPDCLFCYLTVQSQKLTHLKLSGSVWRQCCCHLHLYCLSLAEPSLY